MIELIPAITINQGKVVKPVSGNVDELIIYDKDPIDVAMHFEQHGFKRVHLIDIEGAKRRKVSNYKTLELIAKYTKLNIDFTGGVTTDGDVRTAFEFGARSITVATTAVQEPDKFKSWLISYGGEKVFLAADSKDGIVYTKGWKNTTGVSLHTHLQEFEERGVRYVKATEIARDGTMLGPNFELYRQLVQQFPDLRFIACGGIRSADDVAQLEEIGVWGVIFGKSFYEGLVKLEDLQRFL